MTRAKVSHYNTLAPAAKFESSRPLLPPGQKSLYSPLPQPQTLTLAEFQA